MKGLSRGVHSSHWIEEKKKDHIQGIKTKG
jgi:hypothetical protein